MLQVFNSIASRMMGYTPFIQAAARSNYSEEKILFPVSSSCLSPSSPSPLSSSTYAKSNKESLDSILEKQHYKSCDSCDFQALLTRNRLNILLWNILGVMLAIIVPSCFRRNKSPAGVSDRKLISTAWLDGLRGIAALFVVFHHSSLMLFPWYIHEGWHSTPENQYLIQIPIVRLLVSGIPQVCVFFAVSGYALAYRPLFLISQQRYETFQESLASSIFRRHPRLFVPACTASLFSALLTVWGAYGNGHNVVPGTAQPFRSPPRIEGGTASQRLVAQLWNWWYNALHLTNPFKWSIFAPAGETYDPNQWTLPIEYQASLIVFLLLAVTSRFRPLFRLFFLAMVTAWVAWRGYFAPTLFVGGMLIAENRIQTAHSGGLVFTLPSQVSSCRTLSSQPWSISRASIALVRRLIPQRILKIVQFVLFLMALHFLSTPEMHRGAATSWGYAIFSARIPENWGGYIKSFFWPCAGALLLVAVLDYFEALRDPLFTNRFSQYMGRISYALYLVHGPLLYSIARPVAAGLNTWLGITNEEGHIILANAIGGFRYGVVIIGTVMVAAPIMLVVADAGTRFVDEATVKGLKKFYSLLVVKHR